MLEALVGTWWDAWARAEQGEGGAWEIDGRVVERAVERSGCGADARR